MNASGSRVAKPLRHLLCDQCIGLERQVWAMLLVSSQGKYGYGYRLCGHRVVIPLKAY